MSGFHYTIYSDGGSSRGGAAAGACVIDGHLSGRRRGALIFLGEATNNEAEIAAALLGFSFVRVAAAKRNDTGPVNLHWVSDSEYLLKSATEYIHNWQRNGWRTAAKEPVKNQGLWRAYLALTRDFTISIEHVRGHTGHPENELCDLGANWTKDCGEEAIGRGEGKVEVPDGELGFWYLVDGREFLSKLRAGGEEASVYTELECALREILARKDDATPAATEKKPAAASSSLPSAVVTALKDLKTLEGRLKKGAKTSPDASRLAAELSELLKRWNA